MSFWFSDTSSDRPRSIAIGRAPLSEIWDAAREQGRLVENTTAQAEAFTRAYDERIRAIEAATGETFQNPMNLPPVDGGPKIDPARGVISDSQRQAERLQERVNGFNAWLADVAKRHPDQVGIIRPETPVDRDAEALARNADERLAKAMAGRDGMAKWAALLGGAVQGSLYDPLQVATLFAGGGPGAARTIGGRILTTALKEAAVNGIVEAAMQPQVQAWREQAGLEAGLSEAMQNVAFAAGAGGVLGGIFQAGAEGIGRVFRGRDLDRAAEAVAASPAVRPEFREALAGDTARAVETLEPIRAALPAEARGAMDALTAMREQEAIRPPAAATQRHDQAVTAALRSAQTGQTFIFEPDPDQVRRIVDRIAPETAARSKGEATLSQFLMRAGGVQDYKGELRALGLENASERFTGRLVREGGMPLDDARRAAAEAGFFDHLYGTPDQAAEKSTIRDLLDELDTGSREAARAIDDGGRAYADSLVYELVGRAGPAVDDALIVRAAELANAEGIEPAEALDRVLIEADAAAEEVTLRTSAPPQRIQPDSLRGGLDDPGRPLEDTFFSDADLEDIPDDFDIPFFDDGRAATPDALKAELDRLDYLATVVEACRA